MANITLQGNPFHTLGELPKIGEKAPNFELLKADLSITTLSDFRGKILILNIFPSLDTGTCAASVRQFNKIAGEIPNVNVLCISRDLPFAQARCCVAEGLNNVMTLSDFRNGAFGKAYGLEISDGPLQGLHSRVVILINEKGEIVYTQQVQEIVDEPKYDEVLAILK